MIDAHATKELIKRVFGKVDVEQIGLGNKLYRIVMDGSEERVRMAVNVTLPGWTGIVVMNLRNGQPHKWGDNWHWLYDASQSLDIAKEWIYALE